MTALAPSRSPSRRPDRDPGLAALLHAEWTKFRTVRGWVIGMLVAALLTIGFGVLTAKGSVCGEPPSPANPTGACPTPPAGPGGEWVSDSFYFAHRPVGADGSITARVTSLTGERSASGGVPQGPVLGATVPDIEPWSKGGIIMKASLAQGSAYAAMIVTGTHGVRMQWNYTGDTAGLGGAASAGSPRWLRLARAGDVITGYDSADGARWLKVGSVTLAGLPPTALGGMLATSPGHTVSSSSLGSSSTVGGPTLATATFDQVALDGAWGHGPWAPTAVHDTASSGDPPRAIRAAESFRAGGGGYTVTGSGDIAPDSSDAIGSTPAYALATGLPAALIAMVVIAAMFMTTEYRHSLVRLTLAASPRRVRVLAAKAIVIAAVTFAAGLAAAAVTVPVAERLLHGNGNPIYPVSLLTLLRVEAGSAAVLALAAILALALGTILRGSAGAVTAGITVIVLPYILGTIPGLLPASAGDWLLRVTPAAAFSIQQVVPAYPQVIASYVPFSGYYPLPPWGGFAVLCAWTAAALVVAAVLLRRRDA
jgi:hypothetical protein